MSNAIKHTKEKGFNDCVEEIIRKGKASTATEIAKKLGYSRGTYVLNIQKGKEKASPNAIKKMVEVYGVSAEYIYEGKKPMFLSHVAYGNDDKVTQLNKPSVNYGMDAKDKRIAELEYTIELQKEIIKKYKQSEAKAKAG